MRITMFRGVLATAVLLAMSVTPALAQSLLMGKVMDAQDKPVDGAVIVLNGGARSEQVRAGRFRFDAVRSGEHTIELLAESLPQDSVIQGAPRLSVAVGRASLRSESTFVISIATRPEIRRLPARLL